jgi:ubiquinone/menaquinone biosynthesis C-methylase UbiE/uncharacterized protein YbaR (Trm112 family)
MKLRAVDHFACPLSKKQLKVHVFEANQLVLNTDDNARARRLGINPETLSKVVREGILYCDESRCWYPLVNGVPILLDYATELHRDFRNRHAGSTNIFDRYELPNGTPRPGEALVQKSFTAEWNLLAPDDRLSFGLTAEQRDHFIRLELEPLNLNGLRSILEVGAGSGFETLALDRVIGGEICGIDLNLALLRNGAKLDQLTFANVAIASLFALPAKPKSFDLVYSSGCLHHTYSTKAAFDEISQYRKDDGAIYIWVYAQEDMATSWYLRASITLEERFRPILAGMSERWRTPIMRFMARRFWRRYRGRGVYTPEGYSLQDAEHHMRDRWTPLYAHFHSFKEVIVWFREKGLDYRLLDPKAYADYFTVRPAGIGILGVSPVHRGG